MIDLLEHVIYFSTCAFWDNPRIHACIQGYTSRDFPLTMFEGFGNVSVLNFLLLFLKVSAVLFVLKTFEK